MGYGGDRYSACVASSPCVCRGQRGGVTLRRAATPQPGACLTHRDVDEHGVTRVNGGGKVPKHQHGNVEDAKDLWRVQAQGRAGGAALGCGICHAPQ